MSVIDDELVCMRVVMSSQIEVDESLMNKALEVSGLPARETAEEGLRLLIQLRSLGAIRGKFGQIPLDGDLETLRYGGTRGDRR